jgi:hypothetical protein
VIRHSYSRFYGSRRFRPATWPRFYFPTFNPTDAITQLQFRARNDDDDEVNATWIDAANTDWSQNVDANFRIRYELGANQAANTLPGLEHRLNGGSWVRTDGSTSVLKSVNSTFLTDNEDCTQQLGVVGGFIVDNNGVDENNGVTGGCLFTNGFGSVAEFEFCLQIVGADVHNNDTLEVRTIQRRVPVGADPAWMAYNQSPTITIIAPAIMPFGRAAVGPRARQHVQARPRTIVATKAAPPPTVGRTYMRREFDPKVYIRPRFEPPARIFFIPTKTPAAVVGQAWWARRTAPRQEPPARRKAPATTIVATKAAVVPGVGMVHKRRAFVPHIQM